MWPRMVSYVRFISHNLLLKDLSKCRCFCTAAGGSLFQCSSNDLIYNKLHAEAFPEVVSSASAEDEINDPTTGNSTAAVAIENQATTPAEIQKLLARVTLVNEEGGDMFGVLVEIQEWLLSLPDTAEVGSWVSSYPVMPPVISVYQALSLSTRSTHTPYSF